MLSLWIEICWVSKFAVVVLGIDVAADLLSSFNEVVEKNGVGDVEVQVVFELLKVVHPLNNIRISPNSSKGKRSIIQLPSSNPRLFSFISFLLKLSPDLHGVVIILSIEMSGEIVHLDVHFSRRHLQSFFTGLLGLNKCVFEDAWSSSALLHETLGPHGVDARVVWNFAIVAKRLVWRTRMQRTVAADLSLGPNWMNSGDLSIVAQWLMRWAGMELIK